MASTSNKRALPPDGVDSDPDAKRIRSNHGSPAPPPPPPAANSGTSDLQRKKQEAAARMAAVKAKLAASRPNAANAPAAATPPPPPPPSAPPSNDIEAKRADAARKIAEMRAKMAAKKGQTAAPAAPAEKAMSESQQRLAEARARAQQIAAGSKQRRSDSPAIPIPAPSPVPPPREDAGQTARGGLGIGLHPSLLGDLNAPSGAVGKGAKGPKFSTTKGNNQPDTAKINPYLADVGTGEAPRFDDRIYDPSLAVGKRGERTTKQLEFNPRGKYMAQANALRQQAQLEDMKKRIAAENRKTEIESAGDKAFLVSAPPDVEWWDEGLLDSGGDIKIDPPDSIVTALIQHPVILAPPQNKFLPAPKPLMLTPTEQKKLRRQRRMADMKEEQAKIRLGLVEPPPPKVKKSNMMRVLGEQAVKDPTAVEARVNREIAQRADVHVRDNHARQLTPAQRAEKLKTQQLADEEKGIRIAVFRVESLASGKHRYQVDINAKQHGLTGLVVLNPDMNLIIVEGGTHSLTAYKKLMLNRIKWTENTPPLSNASANSNSNSADPPSSTFISNNDGTAKGASGTSNPASRWLGPLDESGVLKDLGGNGCRIVWEGAAAARAFKRWGSRACETDGEAREALRRGKMENMWTLARSLGQGSET